MSMGMRTPLVLIALTVVIGVPRAARADGYASAGLGLSAGSASADGRANFVAAIGWLPREPIGVEADLTYAPSFFKDPGALTENRLATLMGNVVIAGWSRDRGRGGRGGRGRGGYRRRGADVRPYASGGFGLMSETVATAAAGMVSNQHLGVNAGLGVLALPRNAFGVRFDVRYFQDLVATNDGNTSGIDFGSLHFWRVSIGVVGTF
jgi:hypothetical protein